MHTLGSRRALSTAIPLVLTAMVIAVLAAVQYQWLTELGSASRARMERDLRVAVQAATTEVTLEVARLATALERSGGSQADVEAIWNQWRRVTPWAGGLFRSIPPFSPGQLAIFTPDSTFIADSLLPTLGGRIAATAELGVAVAIWHRDGAGVDRLVATWGPVGTGAADVVSMIGLTGGDRRLQLLSAGPLDSATGRGGTPALSWSAAETGATAVFEAAPWEWSLHAWHEAGSLEQAVDRVRHRNLAVGFGLIAVLVAFAAMTLMTYRRNERLATDRATILAGISHEVRTPIAVIRSAAENLAGGFVATPGQTRDYGRLIEREAARLEDNLEGALGFARAAAPGAELTEVVDLHQLALDLGQGSEAPERVEVVGKAVSCRGDRRALAVALRNLIQNALAYSPADRPVTVEIGSTGSMAEVAVMDRGSGVPSPERGRIFEPFGRGAVGMASGRPGLGLGLALADRVARAHRGTVACEDRPGGGAIFRLRLPLR